VETPFVPEDLGVSIVTHLFQGSFCFWEFLAEIGRKTSRGFPSRIKHKIRLEEMEEYITS
jgi:hypothetical protein